MVEYLWMKLIKKGKEEEYSSTLMASSPLRRSESFSTTAAWLSIRVGNSSDVALMELLDAPPVPTDDADDAEKPACLT